MNAMNVISARGLRAALVAGMIAVCIGPAAQAQDGSHPLQALLGRAQDFVHGQVADVKARAWQSYVSAPRKGSCADRRAFIAAALPDAVQFARWDRDIYQDGHDAEMEASGATVRDLGDGRVAYREPKGQRYAEVRSESRRIVVVFRGTRVAVGSDVLTDVAAHVGVETGYYEWAADLVAKVVHDHAGMPVVATGQSLGGGLALYAVLRNPGTHVIAFNPAGLSLVTWLKASTADRARMNADAVVFTTRNDVQIEPISALSFAGRSILPGHIVVVGTDVLDERSLHGPVTVAAAMERLAATNVGGTACEGDIGVLVR
jgi:hypothetical protein